MLLLIVLASALASARAVQLCRFVCPANVSPLTSETLGTNGGSTCLWTGGGFGFRFASYDSVTIHNGNIVPGSESSNNRIENAQQYCVSVADGWAFAQGQVCITDPVSPRILASDTFVPITGGASPEACTAACDAQGFTFAGVEFGSECHCGTGFSQTIAPALHTQCTMACAGNSSETCGGPGLIEVFAGPNPPRAAQLPAGWSAFADAPCAQDSAARMFTDTLIAGPALAATDTPAACVEFCIANGFTKAGVEGGDECYCGTTFRDTPQALSSSQCDLPCQGAIGVTCGGDFAIQLYTSS